MRDKETVSAYQTVWGKTNLERNTIEHVLEYQQTGAPKRCGHCKNIKPLTEFILCRQNKDGLDGWCKACRKAYKHDLWERKQSAKLALKTLDN